MNDLETAHRRALRRSVDMPCEVISNYVDEPLLYWATDLSPYGLWLDTPFPMAGREQVVVCFKPPVWWPGRELTLFAEVIRSTAGQTGTGMGLVFLDITVHERRALSAWLRGRPPPLPKRRCRSRSSVRPLPVPRYALASLLNRGRSLATTPGPLLPLCWCVLAPKTR